MEKHGYVRVSSKDQNQIKIVFLYPASGTKTGIRFTGNMDQKREENGIGS